MESSDKLHVVCMALPFQGHINAMLKLGKILHSMGFFITFVNTESNHKRFLRSRGLSALDGLPDFRFATIPDGLPPADLDKSPDVPSLCASTRRTCSGPFVNLITALNDPCSGVPPVSCVISDALASFTLTATAQFSIPNLFLSCVSACGFMGFFYYKELVDGGIIPLKSEEDFTNGYLDKVVDWIPGLKKLRLKDLPTFIQTTDHDDAMLNFIKDATQEALQATAILLNTFHELEGPVVEALSSILPAPIYEIGPLSLFSRQIHDGRLTSIGGLNFWSEDSSCMEWLEKKEPGSVLYVNFGSITVLTSEQLIEFAWGLANSGYHFLWVIRRDLVVGETAVLPKEFSVETEGRSFLTSWCSQEEVLAHEAVGGFLTHCGWNSTTESISAGVPMICWPFFAEQQMNCKYLCSEWGIGMEIDENVKREEVEMLIKELMEGQKGREMKRKASDLKGRAAELVEPGGASRKNLERIIEEFIINKKTK